MSASRPVRIPRTNESSSGRVIRAIRTGPRPSVPEPEIRPNRAGLQRTNRLTLLFLVAVAVLYAGFSLFARTRPGGTGPGTTDLVLEFGLVALAVGAVGAILTLASAPRRVLAEPDAFTVVGRFGGRTEWRPLARVNVQRLRRYPSGLLSGEEVDSVAVSGPDHWRRTYLIQSGLLPESTAKPGP